MDIQKEREAYLKMLIGNDAISNDQADTLKLMSEGSHFYTYGNQVSVAKLDLINWGWNSWVDAKSQAVPEGFVLVPRELSADEARKHAEAMFNKVERMARNEQRDLSESEFELFKNRWIDARTLTIQFDWKAMIEAQEQSHE